MKIAIVGAGGAGGALDTASAGTGHNILYGARRPADDKVAAFVRR